MNLARGGRREGGREEGEGRCEKRTNTGGLFGVVISWGERGVQYTDKQTNRFTGAIIFDVPEREVYVILLGSCFLYHTATYWNTLRMYCMYANYSYI